MFESGVNLASRISKSLPLLTLNNWTTSIFGVLSTLVNCFSCRHPIKMLLAQLANG